MTELEQALVRLGDALEFPETPDIASAVRRRLGERPEPRRLRRPAWRTLAIASAVLLAALGAAFAVPPARSAILDFFGLRGATIERVETLPEVPPPGVSPNLMLGRPVPLEEAEGLAAFPVLVPQELGEPDHVFYSSSVPGGRISLVYGPEDGLPASRYTGVGLLVTEFRGDLASELIGKLVGGGANIEVISVDGKPGYWIAGGPHILLFRDAQGNILEDTMRLAGSTLLFEHGNTLVRLEGSRALTQERAVELAESMD